MNDLARNVTGISALEDELRRRLYLFVASQPSPVGREHAARALGIPAHQAKFHLDRLEEAGLLESEYVRLSGRSGPGAGRPAKTYRRRPVDISVSLPEREYALAGELMATAIDDSADSGTPVAEALGLAARQRGRDIGLGATGPGTPLQLAAKAVNGWGYEPRIQNNQIVMANCPFRGLTATHPRLVCTMNHELLSGLCEALGGLDAALEPGEGRCCVVLKGATKAVAR